MVAKHLNKQAGFLLIEVLAVVALVGVLAGVLLPQSLLIQTVCSLASARAANLLAADARKLNTGAFGEGEQGICGR